MNPIPPDPATIMPHQLFHEPTVCVSDIPFAQLAEPPKVVVKPLSLFEIWTGQETNTAVVAFAWAASEESAMALFRARNPDNLIRRVTKLFDAADKPFCTLVSGDGWEN